MNLNNITPGLRVRINTGHWTDRTGTVLAIGTKTVLLDIGEPLLISVLPKHLEKAPEDPLPPGWEEFEI
ncbi:hypothetical protein D3C75_594730 [compost metagenome]